MRRALVPGTVRCAALALLTLLALIAAGCGSAPASRTADSPVGPRDTVRIVTDTAGIPHIHARSLEDLYYAWGWVTARDRLWQLQLSRRAARGELSEWLGNSVLRDDGGAQLFDMASRAAAVWERERRDPAVRMRFERYADGINAWIAACRLGRQPWPAELTRLGRTADTWRPEDTCMLVFAQGMVLDFDLPEIAEGRALTANGPDWIERRRRFEPALMYTTVPAAADRAAHREAATLHGARTVPHHAAPAEAIAARPVIDSAPGIPPTLAAQARRTLGRWLRDGDPEARASNVFAVGAGRSASGKPLFANDPHLGLAAPGAFHVVHVTVPGQLDAVGAAIPGLPVIASGRNRHVAWGVTALSADVFDVYADTLSQDRRSVRWQGAWVPLRTSPYRMRFRLPGGVPVPVFGQVRQYTPHGPVVAIEAKRHIALSVRWACDDREIRFGRILGLEASTSASELVSRYQDEVTPGLNVVAADDAGGVVYQAIGMVPVRAFPQTRGLMPGDGRHEWSGFVPRDSMPRWEPPRDGFVVNANNLPARVQGAPDWPRHDWAHDRAWRIHDRLAARGRIDLAELGATQNDVFSKSAERFVPLLLAHADPARTARPDLARAALDTLRAWRYEARRALVAPTLWRAWYGALQRRSSLDGLQGLTLAALEGREPGALRNPDGAPETAAQAVTAALDTALVRLTATLGPDLGTWTWERAHRARFKHRLRDRGPFEPPTVGMDGDNSTPSVGRSELPWSVEVTHGPVFRHLVDLAVPDSSLAIVAPGNSGAGPHSADLAERWARHEYVPLLLDWERIERYREAEIILPPR